MFILDLTLSPTIFLFNEKNGILNFSLCSLISSIRLLLIYFTLLYFKKNVYIEQLNFNPKLSRIQIQKGTVKECFHMLNNIIDEL